MLALDGALTAIVGALFLRTYIGSVPFPISAVLSGVMNAALVWAALHWTSSPRVAAAPVWAFLVTVGVLTFGGPGDDLVFGPGSTKDLLLLVSFVVLGVAPATFVVRRHR